MPALDTARPRQGRKVAQQELLRSRSDQQTHLDLTEWEKQKDKTKEKAEVRADEGHHTNINLSQRTLPSPRQSVPHPARLSSSVKLQIQLGSFQWI